MGMMYSLVSISTIDFVFLSTNQQSMLMGVLIIFIQIHKKYLYLRYAMLFISTLYAREKERIYELRM